MRKPAGLTGQLVSCRGSPWASTSTSELAVISSKRSPYGLMRKRWPSPGIRAERCVNTRSVIPKSEMRRYAAARSSRSSASVGARSGAGGFGMDGALCFIALSDLVGLQRIVALGAAEVLGTRLIRIADRDPTDEP